MPLYWWLRALTLAIEILRVCTLAQSNKYRGMKKNSFLSEGRSSKEPKEGQAWLHRPITLQLIKELNHKLKEFGHLIEIKRKIVQNIFHKSSMVASSIPKAFQNSVRAPIASNIQHTTYLFPYQKYRVEFWNIPLK